MASAKLEQGFDPPHDLMLFSFRRNGQSQVEHVLLADLVNPCGRMRFRFDLMPHHVCVPKQREVARRYLTENANPNQCVRVGDSIRLAVHQTPAANQFQ
jgi:hypothetical protein